MWTRKYNNKQNKCNKVSTDKTRDVPDSDFDRIAILTGQLATGLGWILDTKYNFIQITSVVLFGLNIALMI